MEELSILIVGYGDNDLLISCIKSFYKDLKLTNRVQFEIIVVENHPDMNVIPTYFENKTEIKWLKSPNNCGYGRGNNLAFKKAKGEIVLILNPDIEISADSIMKLYFNSKNGSQNTISSCKLIYPNGKPQINYFTRINHLSALINQNLILRKIKIQLKESQSPKIIGFSGALFIFKRNVIQADYIFNPIYFMYEEENDFFYKMEKMGVIAEFNENVTAIHKTEGTIDDKSWMSRQKMVSKFQFIRNNFGVFYYLLFLSVKSVNIIVLLIFFPFLKDKKFSKNELYISFSNYWYFVRLTFQPKIFINLLKN